LQHVENHLEGLDMVAFHEGGALGIVISMVVNLAGPSGTCVAVLQTGWWWILCCFEQSQHENAAIVVLWNRPISSYDFVCSLVTDPLAIRP
jgi:hypothetical protein